MTQRRMQRSARRAAPRMTLDGSSPASRGPEPLTTYRKRLDEFLSPDVGWTRQPFLEITVETRTRILRSAVIRFVERDDGSVPGTGSGAGLTTKRQRSETHPSATERGAIP